MRTISTAALALLSAAAPLTPARYAGGSLPAQPVQALGGGQVLLELTVEPAGRVSEIATLRGTPPFTDLLRESVGRWSFTPARDEAEDAAVQSRVLVAALFRPPALYAAPSPGEPVRELGKASESVPAPIEWVAPPYPPAATTDAVLAVEVEVSADGRVGTAKVVVPGAGFDAVAVETAGKWRFRPARRGGEAVPSVAYLVFGFRRPVTPGR